MYFFCFKEGTKMRIILIITGLHIGGAERMYTLDSRDWFKKYTHYTASMGEIGANLEKLGYDLVAIDLKNLFSSIKDSLRLETC